MTRVLLTVVALIVYGSLYPWTFHGGPSALGALSHLLHAWPAHLASGDLGDIVVNVLIYIPVGMCGYLALDRSRNPAVRWIAPVLVGLLLSCLMETIQVYIPGRVPSLLDVLTNTSGTLAGTLLGYWFRDSFSGPLVLVLCWIGFQVSALAAMIAGRRGSPGFLHNALEAVTVVFAWGLVVYLFQSLKQRDTEPAWAAPLAAAFTILLLIRGLAPFRWQPKPAPFTWIPFHAMFSSEWIVGLPIFLEKSFYYGVAVWLIHRAGWTYVRATALIAAILAGIEIIQRHLPGRTAEITDPLMAVILGFALSQIEHDYNRRANEHNHYLECSLCAKRYPAGQVHNLCSCGGPLLVRYDLEQAKRTWDRESLKDAPKTMWRYAPVLPPANPDSIVSLGEGMTPLLHTHRLGHQYDAHDLWVKDEGINPTGSFKARGLSCAISMCVELGIRKVAIPSAGNAASALAAYAAAAGLESYIFMPRDVPQSNFIECKAFGAHVTLVDGLISDCGKIVAQRKDAEGWFDVSTLKEPYRIEGKKTMGYEVAEQLGWTLPDVIFYPAGGGVGMIGMWKAFEEMEALGWIGSKRPKMIAVQSEGCQPVVRAYQRGEQRSEFWENANTVASGLRVPKPLGDFLMLDAIRKSGGTAIAVSDSELIDASIDLASREGIFAAPEGGACVAALAKLLATGFLKPEERIVIYNTGSGLKYLEAYSPRFPRDTASEQDKLGGLITPR